MANDRNIENLIEKYYLNKFENKINPIGLAITEVLGEEFGTLYKLFIKELCFLFLARKEWIEFQLGETPSAEEKEVLDGLLIRMEDEKVDKLILNFDNLNLSENDKSLLKECDEGYAFLSSKSFVILNIFIPSDGFCLDFNIIRNILFHLVKIYKIRFGRQYNSKSIFSDDSVVFEKLVASISFQIVSLLRSKGIYIFDEKCKFAEENLENYSAQAIDLTIMNKISALMPFILLRNEEFIDKIGKDFYDDFMHCILGCEQTKFNIDDIIKKIYNKIGLIVSGSFPVYLKIFGNDSFNVTDLYRVVNGMGEGMIQDNLFYSEQLPCSIFRNKKKYFELRRKMFGLPMSNNGIGSWPLDFKSIAENWLVYLFRDKGYTSDCYNTNFMYRYSAYNREMSINNKIDFDPFYCIFISYFYFLQCIDDFNENENRNISYFDCYVLESKIGVKEEEEFYYALLINVDGEFYVCDVHAFLLSRFSTVKLLEQAFASDKSRLEIINNKKKVIDTFEISLNVDATPEVIASKLVELLEANSTDYRNGLFDMLMVSLDKFLAKTDLCYGFHNEIGIIPNLFGVKCEYPIQIGASRVYPLRKDDVFRPFKDIFGIGLDELLKDKGYKKSF